MNIVNNAKVDNPLKDKASIEKKKDGHNLLDRFERLTLANTIYTDLLELRYRIQAMSIMAQYGTKEDLLFAIDPEGWMNLMTAKNQVNTLIFSWNSVTQ